MLFNCQWCSSNEPPTELNYQNLDHNSEEFDGNEEPIVEEPLENVKFFLLEFTTIYLIEHLHENENLEENRVMHCDVGVPWAGLAAEAGGHIENHGTLEKNYC